MRVRAPANLYLRRAQLILLLGAVLPTVLATPVGIILLVSGGSNVVALVSGILVLSFAGAGIVGYVVVTMLLKRSETLVDFQNEYLSSISHELRTPMTSMRMFTEALLDDRLTDSEQRRESLQLLHGEIVRLDALVSQLLDLSRIESGRFELERSSVAVDELIARARTALSAQDLGRQPSLHCEIEAGLRVLGDEHALTQIFSNLLSNAHKHGGSEAQIWLRARARSEREVVFEVEDDGPGIPTHERRRVFERFERGERSRITKTPGSGLGLSIVHALVRKHAGQIRLEDREGGGTRLRVVLPRA